LEALLPGSVVLENGFERGFNYHNPDIVWIDWYLSEHRIDAERYILCEWDCYANQSFEEAYSSVWSADVVGSHVYRIERDKWHWFDRQAEFLPWHWRKHAAGIMPFNGIMLSRKAMEAIAGEPIREGIFCELRLPTLCRRLGYEIAELPIDVALRNIPYAGKEVAPAGVGVWHPVKRVHKTIVQPPPIIREIAASKPCGGCSRAQRGDGKK
jgi:hypothetical protein